MYYECKYLDPGKKIDVGNKKSRKVYETFRLLFLLLENMRLCGLFSRNGTKILKTFLRKRLLTDFLILKFEIYELQEKGHRDGRGIVML